MADQLNISFRTVERHRSNLLLKTNTNNSLKLLVFAIKNNLVKI
ncbi:MAG: LuxR C-terminal-related transcriptional regulator [Prolixibacteraceae bacterium]